MMSSSVISHTSAFYYETETQLIKLVAPEYSIGRGIRFINTFALGLPIHLVSPKHTEVAVFQLLFTLTTLGKISYIIDKIHLQ